MDYGYSLLLGEFVTAEEVEVGDCEQFQITCPVCYEAVFKKTRTQALGGTTHFLSHYRADTADENECTLRTKSVPLERLEFLTMQGRGQTLIGFMNVLDEAIDRALKTTHPEVKWDAVVSSVSSRPAFSQIRKSAALAFDIVGRVPDPQSLVNMMLVEFPGFADRSKFWRRRQSSYLLDVIKHLQGRHGIKGLQRLAVGACVKVSEDRERYLAHHEEDVVEGLMPRAAILFIDALVKGKSQSALKSILRREKIPMADPASPGITLNQTMQTTIATVLLGPLIGTLASIPFVDLAAGQERGPKKGMEEAFKALFTH